MTLSIHDLDSFYGSAHILHGISLELGSGEAIALIGRNGAGKSTTLRSIVGLVTERRGRISHDGVDISGLATFEIARRGIGYVPEDRRIFTDLTVEENLLVGCRPRRASSSSSSSGSPAVLVVRSSTVPPFASPETPSA